MPSDRTPIETRELETPTSLWAVVVAAGRGRRMGTTIPKQYLPIVPIDPTDSRKPLGARANPTRHSDAHGDPFAHPEPLVLEHTLMPFLDHPALDGLIVVAPASDLERLIERLEHGPLAARITAWRSRRHLQIVAGGNERLDSVIAGLDAIAACRPAAEDSDRPRWVLVHDGARPCLARDDLDRLTQQTGRNDASDGVVLAAPSIDTMKQVDGVGRILATVPRESLWRAFTPQLFPLSRLREALETARHNGQIVTDEASAIEHTGGHPRVLEGSADNRKITLAEDLFHARAWLDRATDQAMQSSPPSPRDRVQRPQPAPETPVMTTEPTMILHPRIGQGFDVHAFGPGEFVTLGGVQIPFDRGLVAHSDGDVLLHALCDALLGASALGDIGQHFPDHDARFAGADSRVLLRKTVDLLATRGWVIGNVDCTVIAQAPRLAPHVATMAEHIAADCRIGPEQVGVKATTTERLGFTGRGEGIAAQAVAMLFPATSKPTAAN